MKTANVSLRNMTLAMLLAGVAGSAWAVGPAPAMSPAAALSAAAGIPASQPVSTAAADAPAIAPVTPMAASTDDDRAETTLKKASALQAKYALRKIQSDIDKLDAAPSSGSTSQFPSTNPLDALRAANGGSPAVPSIGALSSRAVESKPAAPAAPASTMKAIGTYGVGDSAYADMLIDDARTVAMRGTTLNNGYHVDDVTANGVTVSKGRKHVILPVVPGPIQAMASGGSMVPGMTNGSSAGNVPEMSRFNQLTGPNVVNTIPPGLNQPMIIPSQPIGSTAGSFGH